MSFVPSNKISLALESELKMIAAVFYFISHIL